MALGAAGRGDVSPPRITPRPRRLENRTPPAHPGHGKNGFLPDHWMILDSMASLAQWPECEVAAALVAGDAGRAGVAAVAWFKTPGLCIVIGLAMICNLVAGALGGILIPLVMNRLKADPAVASGVFVTTVTDVTGFFVFLGIATLWFGLK